MIAAELSSEVQRLVADGEPFVLATVVRARRPTSVRPGDTAIVRRDGTIEGFVGGVCAESSVRLHSLRALQTGEPLLLRLIPDGHVESSEEGDDGAVTEHNPCLSGGSLEIFLEPRLPPNRLVVVGGSPIAQALQRLAIAAGYDCRRTTVAELGELEEVAAVVVAAHGSGQEEAALEHALSGGVPYVALVASPRRGSVVRDALAVAPELRDRLHTPAGIDIGARTPAEIAISILAELVAAAHREPAPRLRWCPPGSGPPVAVDPVCGMSVAVAPATAQLALRSGPAYFCGEGCRERYAREHPDELLP
ncbi:MAG: XdhC family protein [Solirubrobacterales bacterium]|nr:XdhC family protein [Solirubrobacterales bacterium]